MIVGDVVPKRPLGASSEGDLISSITVDVSNDTSTMGTDSSLLDIVYAPVAMTLPLPLLNNGSVKYEFGADKLRYGVASGSDHIKAANSEVSPFDADIDPVLTLIDDGEVSTVLSQAFDLDFSSVLKHQQRFGRVRMSNAFGSEVLDLNMPMTVEYFTGSFYQTNADDGCTTFNSADLIVIADNLSTPGSSTVSVTNPTAIAGNLDVALAAIFIKSAREEKIDFSHPYFRAGLKVMVSADNKDIKAPADLKGKVVAVKLGTATVEYVETLGAKKVVKFPNIDQAYLEVVTGGADAAMHDTPNVLYYIKTAGNGKVKAVGPDVKAAQYGIAFPQGSPLRDKVNIALLQMMEDGAYADLFRKWFNADPE